MRRHSGAAGALIRVVVTAAVLALWGWVGIAPAGAGVASPEEIARDGCLNGAMYVDAMVRQEQAFLDVSDEFVDTQRAAYPSGLVLDGSRPGDDAAQAAWEDAFWTAYMASWVGVRLPGASAPSGPSAGFQDSDNVTSGQKQQWQEARSSCAEAAPGACRRMVRTADAAVASVDAVYEAAWTFTKGVGVRSQNPPGALYGRTPGLLDALAASVATARRSGTARVAAYRSAEKRCLKALGMSWPPSRSPDRP